MQYKLHRHPPQRKLAPYRIRWKGQLQFKNINSKVNETEGSKQSVQLLEVSRSTTALDTVTCRDSVAPIWHNQTKIRSISWKLGSTSCNARNKVTLLIHVIDMNNTITYKRNYYWKQMQLWIWTQIEEKKKSSVIMTSRIFFYHSNQMDSKYADVTTF
jgi:hypothetical protein